MSYWSRRDPKSNMTGLLIRRWPSEDEGPERMDVKIKVEIGVIHFKPRSNKDCQQIIRS